MLKLLMEGLDTALEKGEISLYLQPQVDAASKRIIGAEALMRWQRDGVFIPPSEFIPIAEETGHIQDLGRWMIHETFQLMYAFEQGDIDLPKLSVNLSVRQLFDEHLIDYLTTDQSNEVVAVRYYNTLRYVYPNNNINRRK